MCHYEQEASYTILTVIDNPKIYTGSLSSLQMAQKVYERCKLNIHINFLRVYN